MAITTLDSFPVRFGSDDDPCDTYDKRTYCQMVNQDDALAFAFEPSTVGSELINYGNFDDDCAYSPGGPDTGCDATDQWWSGQGTSNDVGQGVLCITGYAKQENLGMTANRTYKVVVTIAGYPNNVTNAGTFTVTLGNAVSAATSSTAGVYTFYLTPTDVTTFTGIRFDASTSGRFCLESVSVLEMCTDYSIVFKDSDGNFVNEVTSSDLDGTNGIDLVDGVIRVNMDWSDAGLEDGCYHICISENCDQLLDNPSFDEDVNGDMSVDLTDLALDWTLSGSPLPTYTGNNIRLNTSVVAGGITYVDGITLLPNTTYILKYTFSSIVSSGGSVSFNVGGEVVSIFNDTQGNGTYQVAFTTGSAPTTAFVISSDTTFDGYIDSVYLYPTLNCSQCYDLGTHACTKLLTWYNDDDAFGIPYSSINTVFGINFTHSLRVKAILEKPRYPKERDKFMYSDSEKKLIFARSEKIWRLIIDYLPQYIHDAISVGSDHDHFFIDGEEYIVETDNYEPEWRGRLKLAQSTLEVRNVTYNKRNQNC